MVRFSVDGTTTYLQSSRLSPTYLLCVADTLEARLEDTRRRHLEGKYGQILPLAVIEVGIRIVWAEEHPPRPASPRPVNSEGGIDVVINASDQVGSSAGGTSRQRGVIHADEVGCIQAQELQLSAAILSSQGDVGGRRISVMPSSAIHVKAGGIAPSYGYFKFTPDTVSITPLLVGRPDILTWKEAIEPQLKVAGLKCFDTVATTPESNSELRAEDYLDAGHQAWHSIESTYQITNDLYIGQLEEQLMHLRMGEQETATDYCNQAWRLLATMWMTGVQYLTTSYDTHVLKGLPSSYNLIKRLSVVPGTRATLNEDSLTSYILNDEQGGRPGQLGQSGSDGSGGERPAKDADKHKAARESGQGGGSRRRECRLCHIHDHLSFECPDRSDFDDGDSKGGRERSAVGRPHWGSNLGMEKQSTKSLTSAKNIDSSPGGKERGDKQASCSLVGVVEPTVSLAPEAGKDFQAVAAAMQANLAVILLNSGCSHHLMGTKEAFVDLEPSGDVKHVHGFNRSPQDVRGHSTVALQGESGKQVLILDVLYVPVVLENLLSGRPAEGERREATRGRGRDAARVGVGGSSWLGVLHRPDPLHRPASLLGEVDDTHDGGGGLAGDCLADKVNACTMACQACTHQCRHHHKLGKARGCHRPGH
ncbi:unnamed protein product [Closterium sp. NIES-53]